ncbi:zinc-binding dehydrogenase [Natronocalculus amylovorans]|uniref:Zinc-binding dehydrogenase n=1 Tax=Natronocalculus amylovorans TaxID=2917812 RepID=A0AAE3FZX6_9EURY|nr:zinc-binding dehydrogenase [Natronocalculus amylovorans]MCL9818211.1 zinc-binding dehydrogenase [Natronocalculus amylovorans]NUE03730.1 zinc-binding dehydrogenase [Halorubraceae archaeon YAN]
MLAGEITGYGDADDVIDIVDVPKPEPKPGWVRIRVEACGLNRLDVFARIGHPEDDGQFPKRSGCDITGVVDAVGESVDKSWVKKPVVVYPCLVCHNCEYCLSGEHTLCNSYQIIGEHISGGLAEYVVVPEWSLEERPPEIDPITAAAYPIAFTTAWRMIVTAGKLQPSEKALILGASGGVGNAALQIANSIGAETYAMTSSANKIDRLKDWASTVIHDPLYLFDTKIRNETDGRGVDLVVDHIGQKTWQQSIDSLAGGGRLVICGATSGADATIDVRSVYQQHRQIIGAPMGNRRDFQQVTTHIAQGKTTPVIDQVLPLESLSEAHKRIENGEVFGKIVIEISDG